MDNFLIVHSLSEIIERSQKEPVVIFKYSSDCRSSPRLEDELKQSIELKEIKMTIYKVVVQEQPALSKKISEHFSLKHQTPQILLLNKGKLTYTAHHNSIKVADIPDMIQ